MSSRKYLIEVINLMRTQLVPYSAAGDAIADKLLHDVNSVSCYVKEEALDRLIEKMTPLEKRFHEWAKGR